MSEDIQFDRVEMPGGAACQQCRQLLRSHYFQANGAMLCDRCVEGLRGALAGQGSSAGRFFRAGMLGAGAALLGGIGYALFVIITKFEFALVTIAIGWFVGSAVRRGSGGRGGWRYGLLAVILTYSALALSYVGVGIAEYRSGANAKTAEVQNGAPPGEDVAPEAPNVPASSAPAAPAEQAGASAQEPPLSPLVALATLLGIGIASPVLIAFESPLSGLITGFGVWKAWQMNRAIQLEITGPHVLGGESSLPGA